MSDSIDKLFQAVSAKDYAAAFKACQAEIADPKDFVLQVVEKVAYRYYEHHYDIHVPLANFGLASAQTSSPLFPEDRRWWPFVQQVWALVREHQRSPYSAPNTEVPSAKQANSAFSNSAREGDFDSAFAAAQVLLQSQNGREELRKHSLSMAVSRSVLGGLPLASLAQSWRLAEVVGWKSAPQVLFPALHLLVRAPADRLPLEGWLPDTGTASALRNNSGALTDILHEDFEPVLLFGVKGQAFLNLSRLARAGVGIDGVYESLLITAAQCLTNSRSGHWAQPARALIYTYLAGKVLDTDQKVPALGVASALIHEASRSSAEKPHNRRIEDVRTSFCPTGDLTTLRDLVSHSDAYASVIAARTILEMGEPKSSSLFPALLALAAKNDPREARGQDLLVVEACADAFSKAKTKHRLKLLDASAFFIARIKKDYDLFGAYGV